MSLLPACKRLAAALLFGLCANALAAPAITVTVTTDRTTLGKNDDVVVTVTVANTSSSPAHVLKWLLPSGEIEAPLFEVTRDGAPARYLGKRVKRPTPAASDYVLLAPRASVSARVELSALYEMNITGAYTVRYRAAAQQALRQSGASHEPVELASAPVALWIDARLPRGAASPEPSPPRAGAGLAFNKCSNAQQGDISSAAAAGLAMASSGEAYLEKAALAARYGRWFGALERTRVQKAKDHFSAIRDAFANKPVTVDCGCNKSYYAYVYPSQPYTIYVCKAFWTAPMTGTDSKGGTLLHEMSHFTVVAGTDDWVYGQAGAASLAISEPDKAVDNADSHEYFGENTPELPVK